MVPSRSRKTAGRRGVDAESDRTHLRGREPGAGGGFDSVRRDARHAAMIGGAAAQEAWTAVGLFLNDGAARGDRRGAVRIGGTKYGDHRQADGGGDVHRAGIVADEEMALREECREVGDGGLSG